MTLTAPGADRLPFDLSLCTHSPGLKCSGTYGCQVEASALALWHDNIGQRWSWFITDLRRTLDVDVQFVKTWEPQKRGALHAHAMMRIVGASVVDRRFRAAVKLAAKRQGFGPQTDVQMVDLTDPKSAAMRAGYVAKYATKSADLMPDIRRVSPVTGEIRQGGLRAWSASWHWGESMKAVKARRQHWWASGGATAGGAPATPLGAAGALDLYRDIYADVWLDDGSFVTIRVDAEGNPI